MNRKKAWQLARVVGNEIFMESTLEMAGSQRARILERYERNIDEARRTSFITKFMTSFLLAFLAIGPAMTLVQAKAMLVNPVASNTVLFVIAISLALYYGMAFFFIMFFKMITLGSFMAGNAFKFLGTLPLSYKEIEQIAMSTYLRINLSEIITIIVSVPVVGLAITGSFMFFVASLAASIMTITLANYAMINIASTIAKHISRAGSASRLVIAIRLLTTMGYVIGVGSISMVLVFSLDYVQTLLITGVVSSDVMNILLPIIPFPFSGSYISALSLMPLGTVDAIQITMIFTGFAFFALIVFGMARSGRKKLRGLSRIEIQDSNVKARAASTVVVSISTRKPLPALVKKTFSIITREYAILLNFVIGIMMPMIIFVMGLSSGDITDAGWASGIVYIGFQVHMVHNAISGGEEKVGSVLTSMPVKTWDVYNARRITMYLNQGISTAICMVLVLCLARDPLEIVMYQTVLISLAMVTVPLYLILYSIAFCRLNGRYTLFINTNVNRGGKLAVMIISCYAIAIVEILFMEMNSRPVASLITEMVLDFSGLLEIKHSVTPFGAAIVLAAIWIVNVSMAAGLEVAARRLFKNRREPQA